MDAEKALSFAVKAAEDAMEAAQKAASAAAEGPGWLEIVQGLTGPVFLGIVIILMLWNRRKLGEILDRVTGVEAMGVKVQLQAQKELGKAVASVEPKVRVVKTYKGTKEVRITEDDEYRVLRRAALAKPTLENRTVLWVDDIPANNEHEVATMRALGLNVLQVKSSAAGVERLSVGDPKIDVIITDISRPEDETDGVKFLEGLHEQDSEIPAIIYITEVDRAQKLPFGAIGLTNRPDELLHLVIDALERVKPLG